MRQRRYQLNVQFSGADISSANMGIWVERIGHCVSDETALNTVTRDEYSLTYVARQGAGTLQIQVGSRMVNPKPGDLILVPPGIPHNASLVPGAHSWETWWIHFGGDQADRLTTWLGFSASQFLLNVGIQPSILTRLEHLMLLMESKPLDFEIDLVPEFYRLLFLVKKYAQGNAPSRASLENLLQGNISWASLDEMASAAGTTKHKFLRSFQQATGVTPWRYLTARRVMAAKGLLATTSLSINEIARKSGFENSTYFSAVFRKHTGITPREFRNRLTRPPTRAGLPPAG